MKPLRVCLLALTYFLTIGNVAAEEETLKFRLIARMISSTELDAPAAGRKVSVSQHAGVAVFEDDRIADKQFVQLTDSAGVEGTFSGYSTYTFLNGDTLKLKYTGGWGDGGLIGHYEVLSGTGAYEGATGEGRFTGAKEPWEKASLLDVTLNIKRSDS